MAVAPTLVIARRIARNAARMIMRSFRNLDRVAVYEKSPADYVTSVDIEAEHQIIEQLQESYPQHSILSEERGSLPKDTAWQWVIDPLDGTGNFVHGLPHFAVSIACLHHGQTEHAVVLDVMRDEEFSASRGGGAMLDGRRIRVSEQQGLAASLISSCSLDSERSADHSEETARCMLRAGERGATLRRSGSAALDLAYVAAGRLDAMWDVGLKTWDMAAGALLVQEAGGLIRGQWGSDEPLGIDAIVCGAPACYSQLLPLLQSVYGTDRPDSQRASTTT